MNRQAKWLAAPDGLESAAVIHHHRRTGTQLRVLDVDTVAWTIELGNVNGTITYRWSIRADSGGFRFTEIEPREAGER